MLLSFSLAILAVLVTSAPVELDARASPPPYRYIHPANAPDKCITAVPCTKDYEGTQLTVRPCAASADQRFRVVGTPGKPDKKPKLKDGRPALLLPCPTGPNVGENLTTPVNGYWDRSDYTHLRLWDVCLDLKDGITAPGAHVQQWQCYRGNKNQQWIVDNK
ncbi:hypothetical protein CspHIS471_0109590 [Cutaneotrichosporon sp. HIS471]|nr:hypothetical protein CspHIS471_0109590 [Cutaneotrichosporon sp. HIS471]